jgi:hypothetical protein
MKFSMSLGVLGLLGVASAVPAAASTINLNTGNGSDPYTITSDTLSPSEGTTVYLVTQTANNWINNLASEWIAPQANQSNAATQSVEADSGSVTYDTTFLLSPGFANATLNLTFLADDWATISLNNHTIYSGPTTADIRSWLSDNVLAPMNVESDLVSGLNTLQFVVYNTGGGTNVGGGTDAGGGPTGLNAQVSLSYNSVPEPSSALPLAGAVLLGGFFLRRRRAA